MGNICCNQNKEIDRVGYSEDQHNELERFLSPQPTEQLKLKFDIEDFNMPNVSEVYMKLVASDKNEDDCPQSMTQKLNKKLPCQFRDIGSVSYQFEKDQEFKVIIFDAAKGEPIA